VPEGDRGFDKLGIAVGCGAIGQQHRVFETNAGVVTASERIFDQHRVPGRRARKILCHGRKWWG